MYKVCLVITYKYICILACSGCQIENINGIRRCVLTKRRGALYTYRLESELALNVGFRFDANLIYIPVYWNQMIRRCDLGSFKGAMYIATLGC